jgi:predicted DNA-binding transcriptional regulator AlpA
MNEDIENLTLLSHKQVAKLIGLSPSGLLKIRQKGEIEYIKAGDAKTSRVLYERKEIDRWLNSRKLKDTPKNKATDDTEQGKSKARAE